MKLLSILSCGLVSLNFVGVSPVKLDALVVPPFIQNGTLDHVILDCPYHLNPGERDGIVLKWYLNSKTVPIYQWIPPSHPQGLGSMRHKINLDYEISQMDPYTRHRALFIQNPSVEMSGEYTCKVSTLENEASQSSTMVVYTPPSRLSVQTVSSSYNSVNVTCLVDHTFPRPKVILYHGQNRDRVRIKGAREVVNRYPDGAWQVFLYAVLEDATLPLENLFECEMFLPKTKFRLSRSTIYSPRQPAVLARSNTFSNKATVNIFNHFSIFIVITFTFIFLVI